MCKRGALLAAGAQGDSLVADLYLAARMSRRRDCLFCERHRCGNARIRRPGRARLFTNVSRRIAFFLRRTRTSCRPEQVVLPPLGRALQAARPHQPAPSGPSCARAACVGYGICLCHLAGGSVAQCTYRHTAGRAKGQRDHAPDHQNSPYGTLHISLLSSLLPYT